MARVSRETAPRPPPEPEVSRETEPDLAAFLGDDTPIARAAAAAVRTTRSGAFPKPTHPRILTVANQKGGVGKTTTTVNVAAGLALRGLNVLVLDLDPQGNASTALGIDHQPGVPSMYDVLVGGQPLTSVVQQSSVENLVAAPATVDLAGAEIELVPAVARETRLKRAVAAYDRPYDYVFIDCPPSLGLLTVNALVAAQEIVIPIQCEFYALEGLGQLLHNVELVRSHLNETLAVSTILLTMYDSRTKLAEQVVAEVRSHFGDTVLDTMIPRSVRISEAPGYAQTVLTYDPASRGAQAYLEAAREIAERGARMEGS
jgi:chromosome partitioning protein